jgi:hypothetical protein
MSTFCHVALEIEFFCYVRTFFELRDKSGTMKAITYLVELVTASVTGC